MHASSETHTADRAAPDRARRTGQILMWTVTKVRLMSTEQNDWKTVPGRIRLSSPDIISLRIRSTDSA